MANGRRDSFETPLERDLDLFLGVGGSGRSPLNPPTPRHEGAGVRVNQEKKWKFIVVYREVIKYIIKYYLPGPGARGLGGPKCTPGRRLPPVSRGKMLPLTQRWHGGAPTWVHVGCSGARLGWFGGDFGPQKGIRGSQNRISVCSDGRFSIIPFTPRHFASFHHFQKFKIQTIKKERLCDAWSIFI